jgi:hypothetical protein
VNGGDVAHRVAHGITPWGLAFGAGDLFVTNHNPPCIARFVKASGTKRGGSGVARGAAGVAEGPLQPRFDFVSWFVLPGKEGQQPNSILAA